MIESQLLELVIDTRKKGIIRILSFDKFIHLIMKIRIIKENFNILITSKEAEDT